MTETLWTSNQVSSVTRGKSTGTWKAVGVSIDTRTIKRGDIFIAITGKRDGHEFVEEAFKKGASVAIVSTVPKNIEKEKPLLIVKDVLTALHNMASFSVRRSKAKIIAITGSVGKTTSKDMMALALQNFGKVHRAEKSFNNHIGLPLTLARAPLDSDYIVLELGMSKKGEISPLSILASPHIALITNVSAAHLASFNAINEIAKEKSNICIGLRKPRICVVSRDSECYDGLLRNVKKHAESVITYGETGAPNYQLSKTVSKNNITCARALIRGDKDFYFKINSPGRHNALNALGVIAVLGALKLDITKGVLALSNWVPTFGRGAFTNIKFKDYRMTGGFTLIDESYNANPKSMEAAINLLANFELETDKGEIKPRSRKIAILGDMLELGEKETLNHINLATKLELRNIDLVHCVGTRMKFFYDKLPHQLKGSWCKNVNEMIPKVQNLIRVNDVVMIKASNGMRLTNLVDKLKSMGTEFRKEKV